MVQDELVHGFEGLHNVWEDEDYCNKEFDRIKQEQVRLTKRSKCVQDGKGETWEDAASEGVNDESYALIYSWPVKELDSWRDGQQFVAEKQKSFFFARWKQLIAAVGLLTSCWTIFILCIYNSHVV